jgi:hypothetical protein
LEVDGGSDVDRADGADGADEDVGGGQSAFMKHYTADEICVNTIEMEHKWVTSVAR